VRVDDVTTHLAFKDMIAELTRIYNLQNSDKYRDEMTCIDPATGRRISVSWLLLRSAEDLKRKRRNSELWNASSAAAPTSWHPIPSPLCI
jgi:4-hydroxyphenylacetate 3-monooxygenase